MLGRKQEETLIFFLDTVTLLLSESHVNCKLKELKDKLNVALALIERDFPISIQVYIGLKAYNVHMCIGFVVLIQDITTHLMHHIIDGIEQFGPVYSTWMYSYERFNSWLSRRALNRFRPEATIMETYRVSIQQI